MDVDLTMYFVSEITGSCPGSTTSLGLGKLVSTASCQVPAPPSSTRKTRKTAAELVAGEIPGLSDEANAGEIGIPGDFGNDRRIVQIDAAFVIAREDRGKIEAKSVDVHSPYPVMKAVENHFSDIAAPTMQYVARAAVPNPSFAAVAGLYLSRLAVVLAFIPTPSNSRLRPSTVVELHEDRQQGQEKAYVSRRI
jgi:hypothetical protein